jgi:hypothetical protein
MGPDDTTNAWFCVKSKDLKYFKSNVRVRMITITMILQMSKMLQATTR